MPEKDIILVIDDNKNNRSIFETNLEMQGFAVYFTENNIQASQKAKEILPDIILLNLMAPGTEEFRMLEHIKNDLNLFDIPIMTLAVKSMPDNIVNDLRKKSDDVLIKPFDVEIFSQKLKNLINIKRNQNIVKLNPNKKKQNSFEIKFKMQTRKAAFFQKNLSWPWLGM